VKIQQVYGDAKLSGVPGIAFGAQRMLAAITADDVPTYKAAATSFVAACSG